MGNDPKYIFFAKAEGNLLKLLCSLPIKKFVWNSLKEKIRAIFSKVETAASHASFTFYELQTM